MDEVYLLHTCDTSEGILRYHSPPDLISELGPSSSVNETTTTPPPSGHMSVEQQLSQGLMLSDFGTIYLSISGVLDTERPVAHPLYEELDSTSSPAFENRLNAARLERLRSNFTRELLVHVLDGEFEYGFESTGDTFVRDRLYENALATKEWINDVFLKNFHNERIAAGILRIVAHLEYAEIEPQGPTMAIAALTHESQVVRECGVRAFENWEFPGCVKYLKSISCRDTWLQEYIESVIASLEELTPNEVGQED